MGLFEWKEEYVSAEQAAEQRVKEKLSNVSMLNIIINELGRAGDWVSSSKGFYDHRTRKFVITKDYIEVYDCSDTLLVTYKLIDTYAKDIDFSMRMRIEYADYNYKPLHACFINNRDISLSRVLYIWATVIQERMKKENPDLIFNEISVDDTKWCASFTYRVPDREYNDWFE